jgi:hypothetical protein
VNEPAIRLVKGIFDELKHFFNRLETNSRRSTLSFHCKPLLFTSRTVVVDNERNIWLHPPRIGSLKILNLSAFLFVKFSIIVGDSWSYDMTIGKNWSHKDFGGLWKTGTEIRLTKSF